MAVEIGWLNKPKRCFYPKASESAKAVCLSAYLSVIYVILLFVYIIYHYYSKSSEISTYSFPCY